MGRKIEDGQPLPDHTKLRYDECYAKVILEKCVPKFKDGLIIQDKPDLYHRMTDTGIEVTEAIDKKRQEMYNLYGKIVNNTNRDQSRNIDRLKQLGVDYNDKLQVWPTVAYTKGLDSAPYNDLYNAIRIKEEKLNSGNIRSYKHNELIVLTELSFSIFDEYKISNKLYDCIKPFKIKFDVIYVVDRGSLFVYNFHETPFIQQMYIFHCQRSIAIEARKMVIEGENDD